MRQCGGQKSLWHVDDRSYNSKAPLALQREPAHYLGYVYFRQVKDSSVKRGYFQKSLVLVSRLPFVRLFQSLLSLIAPEYFEKLAPCLEAVCNEIDQWPAPVPGQTLNLPVMGVVIQVRIPSRVDKLESSPPKQCDQENLLPAPVVLTSVHELDLFRCLQPLKFCCDFRPYFTIHDSEFKELTTRTQAPTGLMSSELGSPRCQGTYLSRSSLKNPRG